MERARGGDGGAFSDLLRLHDDKLRGLAFQLLGDQALMDDVLQDAYLSAYRALPKFEGRADVGTWLYRITYNACVDELRRRKRRPWVDFAEARLHAVPDPGEPLDERAARQGAVRDALSELTPEERAVVWMVDAEGHDYRTVAAATGVPEGTIASRLSRARGRLRETLAAEGSR